MLRYKMLGRTGLRVSELCLGTMSFGTDWGFGADEPTSHKILDAFAEAGGNFLDTANKYHNGQTEEFTGTWLQGKRHRFVVATKYTLAMDHDDPERAHLWDPVVSYGLKISRSHRTATGAVQTQSVQMGGVDPREQWLPFEVGATNAGKKLIGVIRFSEAAEGGGLRVERFEALPGGRVRWQGKVRTHAELREALPDSAIAKVVIVAPEDLKHKEVVDLMGILTPVFGGSIALATGQPSRPDVNLERLVELDAQISECEVELARATAELGKLAAELEPDDPKVRKARNRVQTVKGALADYRAARDEILA